MATDTIINEYKTVQVKMDGKQSLSIPISIKKNGRLITETIDIIVRGFLKFSDEVVTDTTLYESREYQRESANRLENKVIVHPVLFTSKRITIYNGRGVITLVPRSEDILETTEEVVEGSSITDSQIIDKEIRLDEQIVNPEHSAATIIVETGKIREPYKISIEITVISDKNNFYGQTIDRGLSPSINENKEVSSLFAKYKKRVSSNLIVGYFGEDDWVPSIDKILSNNDSSADTILGEVEDLKYASPFGASLLFDSVIDATEILRDSDLDDLRKTIYLFTDNESSISTANVQNAVDSINNLEGDKEVAVMVGVLAIEDSTTLAVRANRADTRDLEKLSFETGGQVQVITTEDDVDTVAGIFYSETVGSMGYGLFLFKVDLGEEVLINNITAFFNIPFSNSNATWKIETSTDNLNFVSTNKTYDENEEIDFVDLYARYIKFSVVLISGFSPNILDEYIDYPNSPYLYSIRIVYNNANIKYLYLNMEQNDIIPYHMEISTNSNEINEDDIKLGVAKSDSINWNDYYNSSQPLISRYGKTVIPIRFSTNTANFDHEQLNKIDDYSLSAKYGNWDPYASFVLYDKEDNIISNSEYKIFPRSGLVILSKALDSDFQNGDYSVAIIHNDAKYKIGMELKNTTESTDLEIYGISYIFSTNKDLLSPISRIPPIVSEVIITNNTPNRYSKIEVNYEYFDSEFNDEDITDREIKWYIDGKRADYLENLTEFNDINNFDDPLYSVTNTPFPSEEQLGEDSIELWLKKQNISILNAGNSLYYTINVSNGNLNSDRVKSGVVKIIESVPVIENFFIKGLDSLGNIIDRIASDTDIIISPPIDTIFHSDSGTNKSIIKWYVNDSLFKTGIYGETDPNGIKYSEIKINEIGKEIYIDYGIRISNGIFAQIIPATELSEGLLVQSPGIVVNNALPTITNLIFNKGSGSSNVFPEDKDITLDWTWFDFESIALNDIDVSSSFDQSSIIAYRKNSNSEEFEKVYSHNDQDNSLQETFYQSDYENKIITDLDNKKLTILSDILHPLQTWKFTLIPNDSIDNNTAINSKEIFISPK